MPPGVLMSVQCKQTPLTVMGAISCPPNPSQREPDVHLVDVVVWLPIIHPHSAKVTLDLIAGPVQTRRTEEPVERKHLCPRPEVVPLVGGEDRPSPGPRS